jgi:hypothetical protein
MKLVQCAEAGIPKIHGADELLVFFIAFTCRCLGTNFVSQKA